MSIVRIVIGAIAVALLVYYGYLLMKGEKQ